MQEEEKNCQYFGLMCRGGRCGCLLVVCGPLLMVDGRLMVVCGPLLVACSRLLVVYGCLWLLPVLVIITTPYYIK